MAGQDHPVSVVGHFSWCRNWSPLIGAGTGLFCDSRILTKFWSSLSVMPDNSLLTNSLRLLIILLLYMFFFPDVASNNIKETPP